MSNPKPDIFWAFLFERAILGHAVDSILDVANVCARMNYVRLSIPYSRTDMARNRIVTSFLEVSSKDEDVLVMLDGDHIHPAGIVSRLARYPAEIGVIGALYFRRGEPYDPLFYSRAPDGKLRNMADWERGLVYEGAAVATGAIAIKRWVFGKLVEEGIKPPFFRYEYPEENNWNMTEDIYFALQCEKVGISHFVDTGIITPHLSIKAVSEDDWREYIKGHPELITSFIDVNEEEREENRI